MDGQASSRQWSDVLGKIHELAETTAAEKAVLTDRIKELEVELSVWKQAHTATREANERDGKTWDNQHLGHLKSPTSSIRTGIYDQHLLVLCVIDGSRAMFSSSYLRRGEVGGRRAGQELMTNIRQHLGEALLEQPSIWTSIFLDRAALRSEIILHDQCTSDQWDGFCNGLSDSSANLSVIDVAANTTLDHKIQEYLQTFAHLPQTYRVFYAAGSTPGNLDNLPMLKAPALSSKLVMIYGHAPPPGSNLGVDVMLLEGLFMRDITTNGYISSSTGSLLSPLHKTEDEKSQHHSTFSPNHESPRTIPTIDTNLPLYKQSPPPCNEFYLLDKCSKEGRCKYSHEYVLTDKQLEELSKNAKQSPCWFLNNEKQCPYGAKCCWGHVCPFGIKCFYASKDRCRFKGPGMHRPKGESSDSERQSTSASVDF